MSEVKKERNDMKVQCPVCPSILKSKQSLYGHLTFMRKKGDQAHLNYQSKGQFKCPMCDFKFEHRSGVGNHIFFAHKDFHTSQQQLIVNLFERGQTTSQIIKNKDVHFGRCWVSNILKESKGNIQCPICRETVRDKVGLMSHTSKQNDDEHQQYLKEIGNEHYQRYTKERQCPVTGCVHRSVWLDRHMRMKIEQGDRAHIIYRDEHYKHTCPVCNKRLQSQQALMGHIRHLQSTDNPHQAFVEEQKQKIVGYFEAGLCIDEIMKQPDIIYSFADGIYPIIHANFDKQTIHERGRVKCGEKNKERMLADPQAYFDRFLTARAKGSKAQIHCAKLLKEKLPEHTIKELDQDIFPGKEIDMTIPEIKIAIEWQGPPHRKPIFGERSLKNLQKSDKAKRTYFKRIGWTLIEVVDDTSVFDEKFVEEQANEVVAQITRRK